MDEVKKQPNTIFMKEELWITNHELWKAIMDCRTTAKYKFRTRLTCKQFDVILTKEQSVLTKIMTLIEGENMQTQYSVLGYRTDLYFRENKLEVEVDEIDHDSGNTDYEIKIKKATGEKLGWEILELILTRNILIFIKLSVKYSTTSNNRLKSSNRENQKL